MKTKAFLALKGVTLDLKSAWIQHPLLTTQYVLGQRVKSVHPSLPFFLISEDMISNDNSCQTGCSEKKYILVSVLAKDLTRKTPFCNWVVGDLKYAPKTVEGCVQNSNIYDSVARLSAVSVLPLDIWDGKAGLGEPNELRKWLKAQAAKRKMKILTGNEMPLSTY